MSAHPLPNHNAFGQDPSQQHHEAVGVLNSRYTIDRLADLLDPMWQKGWQPLDVARHIGVDHPLPLAMYTDVLTANQRRWHSQAAPLWVSHAQQLGATSQWWDTDSAYWLQFLQRHRAHPRTVQSAVEFLLVVFGRPTSQPLLEAPPSKLGWQQGRPSADTGVLAKVRALLAKAESTTFEQEAEALTSKAQELIARHSIDIALLANEVDVPGGKRVYIDAPYAKAKFVLLDNIATANGCRCCWDNHHMTATIIGHQAEMHLVEVLFTSLLLQATAVIVATKPQVDPWGRSTVRSWRNSFWYGYALRIGERLHSASSVVHAQHRSETGVDLLPVLASRSQAVDEAFDTAFPKLGNMSASVSNSAGLTAGHDFGGRADLANNNTVRTASSPAELTR